VRPAYLEIVEDGSGAVRIVWKEPLAPGSGARLEPRLSSGWLERHPGPVSTQDEFLVRRWDVPAGAGGLDGQTLTIAGLAAGSSDVLVRIRRAEGGGVTRLLRAGDPSLLIGRGAGASARAAYLALGVNHILRGVDHLLFVLGLLVIVGRRWGLLLKTVTAFTVAHSLTLAATTLGVIRVSVEPLNVVIALSILFLGIEMARQRRGASSLTLERPWIAAFGFGLVHGFGFASGLGTLDLPKREVLAALLLFNLGVELGQLAFVALYLALQQALRALEVPHPAWAQALPTYVVGSLGAYWTFTQLALMMGS
jgi:hydrogenase/urease accessory protein HupE